MEKRIQIIIITVAVLILLGIQIIVPIFTGDVNLTIPQRIRTSFSWLLGDPELPEGDVAGYAEVDNPLGMDPDRLYELEEQPSTGRETPLEPLVEGERVDLPESSNPQPTETGEDNRLPIDPVFKDSKQN